MKNLYYLIATMFLVLQSCSENRMIDSNELSEVSLTRSSENCNYYLIRENFDFEFIGQKHNEMLLSIMKNLHESKDYSLDNIMNNFEEMGYTINRELFPNSYDGFYQKSYNNVISHFNSENAKQYYDIIYELLEKSDNLLEYESQLAINIENARDADLCPADLLIIEGSSVIAKYSSKFWAPKTWGGQGYYDLYAKNNELRRGWSWENAALGDIAGAGTGLIVSAAVVGFFGGPVGWGFAASVIGDTVAGSVLGGAGIP